MNFADKACPVMFRDASMQQILAFEHPEAGLQLVKGRIEPGENARAAALRELAEESGIVDTAIATDLGTWQSRAQGSCLVAAALHLYAASAGDLDPFLFRRRRARVQILLARRESRAR